MPIEGPKGIYNVPPLTKKDEFAQNTKKRKKKKQKKYEKKEKIDESGPEESEQNRKRIDIKI